MKMTSSTYEEFLQKFVDFADFKQLEAKKPHNNYVHVTNKILKTAKCFIEPKATKEDLFVNLLFDKVDGLALYNKFESESKADMENSMSGFGEVIWVSKEGNHPYIQVRKPVSDFAEETDAYSWYKEVVLKFYEVFCNNIGEKQERGVDATAEKAKAEAEKAKAEAEKAALDKLKAESEKAKAELAADEKKGGFFSKVKSFFGLGDTAEETKPDAKADDAAEKAAAEKVELEAEKAKAEAEKKKAEAEKKAAEKAQAEKAKAEAEKAALEKLKAETEKAKAKLAAAEKMKAELEKAKAEAEKAKAAAEKAQAEASATAEAGTSKKKDPFFADMVKVEGTFSDFYISKYPVTQAQWFAVMGTNPSKFPNNNNPVENVSWEDCQLFLKKLNELTGKKYRLPTSREWQFAASGGKKSKNFKYAGSNDIFEVAWYLGNQSGTTHPVGKKKPNELGLYDMSGNVWEWCEDWSDEKKTRRVCRGGAWDFSSEVCGVAQGFSMSPSDRSDDLGFRLVL
ncbi:MAG: formylglycine-generating enzyme family protein [Paludibacteraceae bacterium]|nr:formylglycine-generating enzyme family protein [Paludibacteraceae bacterium]